MDLKDLPASERSKIASLLSKDKEKDDIHWMYDQGQAKSEDYLLGKKVTDINEIQKVAAEYEESPSQRLARIDMEAKYREDPMTVMKQREAEKRMELLQNTAKVKKLRRLLTMQKLKQEKKRKRKRMEKRRGHRHSSSSSSDESSSGDELLDKFIKIVRQSDEHDVKEKGRGSDSSNEPSEHKPKSAHRPDYRRENPRPSGSHSNSARRPESKPKLSREEIEARRAQMLSDAKEHEKVRSVRTNRYYHEKEEQDAKDFEARKRHGASFISKLKNDHVEKTSIEEGIHMKANSRQRGDMSSNFLRR